MTIMRAKNWIAVLGLAATAAVTAPLPAQAQRDYYGDRYYNDRYNDRYYGDRYSYTPYSSYRWNRGRGADMQRRSSLRSRLIDVGERVNRAESRGQLSRGDARDLYRQLDRVRDLLASDRTINRTEYDRWMDDLQDIQ